MLYVKHQPSRAREDLLTVFKLLSTDGINSGEVSYKDGRRGRERGENVAGEGGGEVWRDRARGREREREREIEREREKEGEREKEREDITYMLWLLTVLWRLRRGCLDACRSA